MISICLTSTTTEGTIHHHTHQSHRAAVEPPPDVVRLSRRRTGVMGSTCEGNRRRVRGRGGRRAVGDTRRACLSSCVHINSISVISACLTSRTAEAPLRPTPTTLTLDGAAPPPPETAPSSTPEERQDKVREMQRRIWRGGQQRSFCQRYVVVTQVVVRRKMVYFF